MYGPMDPEAVENIVAGAWPSARVVGKPEPLAGGYSSVMLHLELANQPDGVPSAVVLRLVPHSAVGAKEFAVQQVVADHGYPAPRIRARGSNPDGEWALMDFVEGSPALGGLDGPALLVAMPRLLGWLPTVMATAMARLHRIDPGPATEAVRSAAPTAAWSVDDLLVQLDAGAMAVGRTDLASAVKRLAEGRPRTTADPVVCHGDFHPFNLITGPDGETVIDWTETLGAEPAYDVAFTVFLLANPPVDVHRTPAAAAIRGIGRLTARRFLKHYRRANPTADLSNLEWCRALHTARVLLEVARNEPGAPGRTDHPFRVIVAPAGAVLEAATGVAVEPPD